MLRRFAGSISTGNFEPEYQAVLDRAISLGYGLPSLMTQQKDNDLIKGLKQDGEWSNLSEFFYMLSTDGSEEFSTLNWVNPDLFQLTKIGTPTFTANEGWKGGLAGQALNTNYSNLTTRQQANNINFSYGIWLLENQAGDSNKADMGCRDGNTFPRNYIIPRTINNIFAGFINTTSTSALGATTNFTNGLKSLSINSTNRLLYQNGVLRTNATIGSAQSVNSSIYLLAINDNGSVIGVSDRTAQIAFAGNGALNHLELYNRLNTRLS